MPVPMPSHSGSTTPPRWQRDAAFTNPSQARVNNLAIPFLGLPQLFERPANTLRWNLWHGKVMTAATNLKVLMINCDCLRAKSKKQRTAASRVIARCQELYTYLSNNFDALTNYGHRHRNGLAISPSRAEGCVDDIGNARMGKRRRMRWSPRGAHRVAVTRAAVLDGRLSVSQFAA